MILFSQATQFLPFSATEKEYQQVGSLPQMNPFWWTSNSEKVSMLAETHYVIFVMTSGGVYNY